MLVLTRKPMQQILIGDNITVTIVKVDRHSVRVSIEAPREVRILRGELPRFDAAPEGDGEAIEKDNRAASSVARERQSRAERRSIPLGERQASATPRVDAHPLRWTMASMRQRANAQSVPAVDGTHLASDNR